MKKASIRVLSYNIHKGFSSGRRRFVLREIKQAIQLVQAELVFLQEVVGHHQAHATRIAGWPTGSQFEFLADQTWPHFAYGRNAVYADGHHGNAILSKYPFSFWENIDVSTNRLETRGILHGTIEMPGFSDPLHVVCLHLGLFEPGRKLQLARLAKRISEFVPAKAPLIVAGDFNDWRGRAGAVLEEGLGLTEAFRQSHGAYARTFPSWMPALRLDRIYFRHLEVETADCLTGTPWAALSDHAALFASLQRSRG